MIMISLSSIPSHSPSVVYRRINDEYLLIPLTGNIADMDSLYRLTETGAFIWELIDGERAISDITSKIVEEFDVEADIAEKDALERPFSSRILPRQAPSNERERRPKQHPPRATHKNRITRSSIDWPKAV